MIFGYALAFANDHLRDHQKHIGKRAVTLMRSLVRTVLDAAIKEACGFVPEIQKTAQKHYIDAVKLIREFGFTCSVPGDIATKKDLTSFLKVPPGTLNSFLAKHGLEIRPIKLDSAAIQSIGHKARRMNGYHINDVVKIVMGMDTEVTAALKKRMFGDLGSFVKMDNRGEIQWREVLRKVFAGFTLLTSHPVGKYRYHVDYFVPELLLCLEENGLDCHSSYDLKKERERERAIAEEYALIRFHQRISLEVLFNAILRAQPGNIIKLYEAERTNRGLHSKHTKN